MKKWCLYDSHRNQAESGKEREEGKGFEEVEERKRRESFNRVGVSGDGTDAVSQEAVLLFRESHVAAWKQDEEDIQVRRVLSRVPRQSRD